jgi:two-component system cell cycle response regulator
VPARILIVEDNKTNRELMVYLFQAFGYLPTTAADGREGLAALARERPDLIVCDLEMPDVNGYEFARALKGDAQLRDIPLVAVTAYAMVGDRDKVLAAGFDGYLAKPINPESFVAQVEAYLLPEKRSGRVLAKSALSESPAASAANRATVLVVDDSAVNRSLIRSTLEPSGYEVIAAASAEEAMECARKVDLDLILSDLHMPAQSGLELLRRIKTDPRLKSVPFLLFSASHSGASEGVLEKARALGAEALLMRPAEPKALLAVVETCLKKVVGR